MSNPFYLSESEDEIDVWKVNKKKNLFDDFDEDNEEAKSKINEISRLQNSVLNRTKACNQIVNDSEIIGNLTSQELLEQREQLKRIEQNMSKIDSNLIVSQKHITSLKSFFGSVTNYFGTNKKEMANSLSTPNKPPPNSASNFSINNNEINTNSPHIPAPNLNNIFDSANHRILKKTEFDQAFYQDMDNMSCGVSRLKELALNMNQELETQNLMLDNHIITVDQTTSKITQQNKQMKKILGGK